MDIPFKQALHYTNATVRPEGICVHIMAGSYDGAVSWFLNPSSAGSANILIAKDGRYIGMVKETTQMAWAQGCRWNGAQVINPRGVACNMNQIAQIVKDHQGVNPNLYLLSIEFEGQSGEPFTDAMYSVGAQYIKEKAAQYGFPIDRYHIIGHYQIDTVDRPNDPGPGLDFDRLINLANGTPMIPFDFTLKEVGADIHLIMNRAATGPFSVKDAITGQVTDSGNILSGTDKVVSPNHSKRLYEVSFNGVTHQIDFRDTPPPPAEDSRDVKIRELEANIATLNGNIKALGLSLDDANTTIKQQEDKIGQLNAALEKQKWDFEAEIEELKKDYTQQLSDKDVTIRQLRETSGVGLVERVINWIRSKLKV